MPAVWQTAARRCQPDTYLTLDEDEGRYEFLFTSVPLNVTGAVGSPANAVAVR